MNAASCVSTAAAQADSVSSEIDVTIPRSMRLHDDCEIPARSAATAWLIAQARRDSLSATPMR